jgi:hypothetical protein
LPTLEEAPKVSTQELVHISWQCSEIIKRVGEGALAASDVSAALQRIIGTRDGTLHAWLALERFTSASEQIENLRKWSHLVDATWTDDQLNRAAKEIPEFDESEPLIPITLCWTLSSLAASIDAKIEVMRHVYGADHVYVTRKFNPDSKHTTIVSGGPAFEPNRLWWQLIDLGANRFKAPNQVPAATAAGCEIFDVICQHPIYVGQQDGSETPYLDLPGLSVKVRGFTGPDTPDATGGPSGRIAVHVNWEGSVHPDHAEPVRAATVRQ